MTKNNLKPYTFIDGDFSMEINVSEEERTIYMSQKEIAKLFEISQGTISRNIKNIDFSKWDTYAKTLHFCIYVNKHDTEFYSLEIIKEIGQKYNPERIEKLEKWLHDLLSENELEIIDGDYEIVRYNQDKLDIPIRFDYKEETLYMTPKEMSNLFDTTERNIYLHMANIFEDEELSEYSIVKESFSVGQTGQKYKITLYNFDMILAVGYRVRSAKAVQFRKWASSVIKKHLHDSYYGIQERYFPSIPYQESNNQLPKTNKQLDRIEPKNIVFSRNESSAAFDYFVLQFSTARKEIFIIDVYADRFLISALKEVPDGVKVIIVVGKKNHITTEELEIYHRWHPNVEITIIQEIDEHDRHIFIDRKYGFMLGASLNALGMYDSHYAVINDRKYIKQIIGKYIKIDD